MPSIEFDDDRPPRSRDELLASVRRDGLRRRYRRNGIVGGVALALVAALAVPVLAGGDGSEHKVAAIDQPTTTVEDVTTSVPEVVVESTTTIVVATTTPATTTPLVCRNSRDPRCGEFRWDPDAGPNEGLDVRITLSPPAPRVGEPVLFTITVIDPDASPIETDFECSGPDFGDGPTPQGRCIPLCMGDQYGPWSPPPRERGERTVRYTHTYEQAGGYTANFAFRSAGGRCADNPYASEDHRGHTIDLAVTE